MSLVLDNSVSARWLFLDGSKRDLDYADIVLRQVQRSRAVVPVTWSLEVANVISRAEAIGQLHQSVSDAFLSELGRLNIFPDDATFEVAFSDTLRLARKHRLTSYDASYLELSLRLNAPLATLDKKLRNAAARAGVDLVTA